MYRSIHIYSLAIIVSQCCKMYRNFTIVTQLYKLFNIKNLLQRLLLQLLYSSRTLAFILTSNTLGSLKMKYIRQSSIIDIFFVLNSFI